MNIILAKYNSQMKNPRFVTTNSECLLNKSKQAKNQEIIYALCDKYKTYCSPISTMIGFYKSCFPFFYLKVTSFNVKNFIIANKEQEEALKKRKEDLKKDAEKKKKQLLQKF